MKIAINTKFLRVIALAPFLCLAIWQPAAVSGQPQIKPNVFVSDHRISLGGKTINYTATAGETMLKDEKGKPIAAIWSTAYTQPDTNKRRPVTFVLHGGPGWSTAEQHIGFMGPKIISMPDVPTKDDGAAPFNSLIDNPNSVLDITDIVFIDPVGTGYSRALGAAKDVDFWTMESDARSIASFIRKWVKDNQRWNSPKYMLGLSYGTTRSVLVAHKLENHHRSMAMNGLILHGPALDFIGLSPLTGNLISYIGFMPTMAAVAHYHGQAGVGKSLEEFVEEARQFSAREYAPALALSGKISDEERVKVAERFAYFTGLDAGYILKSDLKLIMPRYRKSLLRHKGLTVGLSDGRYIADEYDDLASEPTIADPTSFKQASAYYALFNEFIHADLRVKMDRPYEYWNPKVGKHWTWAPDLSSFTNPKQYRIAKRTGHIEVLSNLSHLMQINEDMRVLVGSGYYDLITPLFDMERIFTDGRLPASRVDIKYYESGHSLWANGDSRAKLLDDLRAFLTSKH